MKILIIENEIYLAQSISMKLGNLGYHCDIAGSYDELNAEKNYDIILLSTSTNNFLKAVEKFKESIIILLISYISTDTVSNPLKMGANDYIQKPFMIEELLRKIKHYQDFKRLTILNKAYKSYVKARLETIKIPEFQYKKIKLPLIIKSTKQSLADAFVFSFIEECDLTFSYVNLAASNALEKTLKMPNLSNLLYFSNLQILKENERERVFEFVRGKMAILHSSANIEANLNILNLSSDEKYIENNEILSIDEYIKHMIVSYQNVFADTDLSKKLGISRKSLWEKRKKYGIVKKK